MLHMQVETETRKLFTHHMAQTAEHANSLLRAKINYKSIHMYTEPILHDNEAYMYKISELNNNFNIFQN